VTHPAISVSESAHAAPTGSSGPGGLPFEANAGDSYSALVLLRDEFGNLAELRCLDDGLTADAGFQRAYPAEAAALSGLAEPRVAAAHKYVNSASGVIVAVIRRRLAGVPLAGLLAAAAPKCLDSQTSAIVVRDALTALDALHARGIAHRWVQPEQVIVEPHGGCVLIDAGLVPRTADDDPASAIAADLAAVPALYAACAGPDLSGLRGVVYAALTAAVRTDRPDVQGSDPAVRLTAADLITALDSIIADSFDAGWEAPGRARLAAAVKQHRQPRLRVVDLLPARAVPLAPLLRRTARGSHAGARRDNADLIEATRAVLRQAGAQLVGLWLDGRARRRRNTARRADRGTSMWMRPAFSRYAAPLIAFLITFGLVVLVLSSARSNATQAMEAPTGSSTTAAAQTGQPTSAPNPRGLGTAPAAVGTTPPGAASRASSGPTTALAAPGVTTPLGPPPTSVRSVTVNGFGYTGHGNQAQAIVDVRTSGTGRVVLTVTFSEPDGWTSFAGGPKTRRYTLSGKTEYTITSSLRIPHYCSFFERDVVARVHAGASASSSHGGSAGASKELWSDYC
jgi:hypothetical protein